MRSFRGTRSSLGASVFGIAALASGCLPSRPSGELRRITDDTAGAGGGSIIIQPPPKTAAGAAGQTTDPHGVSGVDPGHGPFAGGTRTVVRGVGFSGGVTVFFADQQVAAADVAALSTTKVQAVTPPHAPGPVDVTVQNGADASTARVLKQGFTYDDFYADPITGPTAGGTRVALHGSGTNWSADTTVTIGGSPCAELVVTSNDEMICVTPPEATGSKPIVITTADGLTDSVLDAYTYADSNNGFAGGLAGSALAGKITVLGFDSYSGDALGGATVIIGDTYDAAKVAHLDATGRVEIDDPALTGPVTVTVARRCSQPTTFVAVPVDTVTMYLDPVQSADCAPPGGTPPPQGGGTAVATTVSGQIIFSGGPEFTRGPWTIVPTVAMGGPEKRVAYVIPAAQDPKQAWQLPSPNQQISEDSSGDLGYSFSQPAGVGNNAYYAIAGIENDSASPPIFTAYAFGVVHGVSTQPGATTTDVAVTIDTPLDHAVTLGIDPPAGSSHGPDRLATSVAVSLGNDGYAVFPGAQRTSLLPLDSDVTFVGLPALSGALGDAFYISSAQAATGPSLSLPTTVIQQQATKSSAQKVVIDGFVRIPELTTPNAKATWDGSTIAIDEGNVGAPADLVVLDIESGNGLVAWTIAAPAGVTNFKVPDLRQLPVPTKPGPKGDLIPGPLAITVQAARIDGFSYAALLYRNLQSRTWNAYGADAFFGQITP